MSSRFEGTADYVATDDLKVAVNASIDLAPPAGACCAAGWLWAAGAWARAIGVTQATATARIAENRFFILRAEWKSRGQLSPEPDDYMGAARAPSAPHRP